MRTLILIAAVIQAVLGGGSHFSVRLPFLNPAGVTYLDGPAPSGLAAGPLQYSAAHAEYEAASAAYAANAAYETPAVAVTPAPFAYAAPAVAAAPAPVAYSSHAAYEAPAVAVTPAPFAYGSPAVAAAPAHVAYASHAAYGAPAVAVTPAPFAYGSPAVATAPAHVAYASQAPVAYAAPVHAVAAVPTVHHVPAVADVPVTRVEAQPGVIQKLVDVVKPAVSTRKFQLRRPAIQKQFYDIEERVVVRPAGSALVELEEPLAKIQKGPAIISPVGPVAAPILPVGPAPIAITPAPGVFVSTTPAPVFGPAPGGFGPAPGGFGPAPGGFGPGPGAALQDEESVVVDNPEFSARAGLDDEQRSLDAQENELRARQQDLHARRQQISRSHTEARPLPGIGRSAPHPSVEVRANGAPLDLVPHGRAGPDVVPSVRALSPEVNQANQQRLIQLLTARGGVAEVGFGHEGPSPPPVGDAGPVRARVLSATPSPPHAVPAGERVSTRRVVVSRPIETVQDIDVVEPVTKLERVAVHHPTLFKTVHHDVARVPTSVPVLGKALAPAIAHAAVPVGVGVGVGPAGYYR